MKAVQLMLEEDEVMFLRMQARMMELMLPETNEQIDSYIRKILEATADLDKDWRKEIAKMQRAMRRVKTMPEYDEFMEKYKVIEKLLIIEMQKENEL